MENVKWLVQTWMASGRQEEINEVVSQISTGHTSLLDVVKSLGDYLTDDEDVIRAKGVDFLASVITRSPKDKINRQSTKVLVTFFISKLEDTETIIPALKGLLTLSSSSMLDPVDVKEIISSIFVRVNMKAHVQATRFLVFSIIDSLMNQQRNVLRDMGDEFVQGYVILAEGEKDPRNLLLALSINQVICIEFDITREVENMFNITFCYFPITFKPPPDDPYGITSDDLRVALRSCLGATSAFGPMAIPLYLEKLQLGSPAIKQDTLQTMSACLPIYGGNVVRDFAAKMWSSLRLEIFQPTDEVTEKMALDTAESLIRTMYSKEKETGQDTVKGLAADICEECLDILREPEKNQAQPAIKMITALTRTTPFIADYTLSQAFPHLFALYVNRDEITSRPRVLMLLNVLVIATDGIISEESSKSILINYKEELLQTYLTGLNNEDTRLPVLEGLKKLLVQKDVLDNDETMRVIDNVNDILEQEIDNDSNAREAILDLLVISSTSSARHIENSTLPILVGLLPDVAPTRNLSNERLKYWRTLQFLKRLCVSPNLIVTLFIRLSTKLDLVCSPMNAAVITVDNECTAAYAYSILRALGDAVELKVKAGHTDLAKLGDKFLTKFYNLCFYLALSVEEVIPMSTLSKLFEAVSRIITSIVRVLPIEKQIIFANHLSSAYLSGDISYLTQGHHHFPTDVHFRPFDSDASSTTKDLVILFAAGIVALQKEVFLRNSDLSLFLTNILTWSVHNAESDSQRLAANHIISSLLNKHMEELSTFISDKLPGFWNTNIAERQLPALHRQIAMRSWIWITKALLVRNSEWSTNLVEKVFELLSDEHINRDAAQALAEIGKTDNTVLTKQKYAIVRVLHTQKYFNTVVPRILNTLCENKGLTEETGYVAALVSLGKVMPKSMWIQKFPLMMTFFMRGLSLQDSQLRTEVIGILLEVSKDVDADLIAQHASSLIAVMLTSCTSHDNLSSTALRMAALKYIGALPQIIRYDVLHPHKSIVVRELGKVLDDSQRTIRKEAVDARTTWFTLTG